MMKFKIVVSAAFFIASFGVASSQSKRDLLSTAITKANLQQKIIEGTKWVQLPAYSDRQAWNALPSNYRQSWIAEGEKLLTYKWQVVPASSYLEFVRTGNRDTMQNISSDNNAAVRKLVLAELAEGKGRFISQIIDGVWSLCEMTTWALSAHLYIQKLGVGLPDVNDTPIDLGVGMTGAMLAWTNFFFKDEFNKVNPLISGRIVHEINRQVLQPYYSRNDFWWMALQKDGMMVNNWNVWVNFNALTCVLLIETDPQKRLDATYKSMQSVDKFINYYKEDGGCEEGPSYWSHAGGMLYQYLDLLSSATGGAVNKFDNRLIGNIGSYIYKAYINDKYYINYADAAAKISPDAGLIYRYGKSTGDSTLQNFGTYLALQQDWKTNIPGATVEEAVENAFTANEIISGKSHKPLLKEFWMPGTQIMAARDKEGSTDGFYFSALGGHNAESHNHNDVGTCIVYYNGQPLLIDIGSGTYTRQTFGPERYSIWTMQSAYHNLPLINGVQQREGAEYKAVNPSFKSTNSTVGFSLNIAAAYPEEAAVKQWQRSYKLNRGKSFSITDNFTLALNNGKTELHFMTPSQVEIVKEGTLKLSQNGTALTMKYDAALLAASIEPIEITDKRLLLSWPKTVYRIILKVKGDKLAGKSVITVEKAN